MGSVRSFGISAAMTPKVASLSCAVVDWDRNLQLEEVPPSTFASTPVPRFARPVSVPGEEGASEGNKHLAVN